MIARMPEYSQNRERLVEQYRHLCARGARKFRRRGLERADLEQVAAIGLIKAADRYDPEMQTPFEAFAWLFVVGELMHHVRDHERMVRAPRRLRTLERRYQDAHDALVSELGCEPSAAQMQSSLGVDRAELDELFRYREQAVPHSIDNVSARALVSYSYTIDDRENRMVLESALAQLSKIERTIILAVYAGGFTQIEIANRLGYSPRHISRLHRAALKKMQPAWVRKGA